jgi:hypothetical protein
LCALSDLFQDLEGGRIDPAFDQAQEINRDPGELGKLFLRQFTLEADAAQPPAKILSQRGHFRACVPSLTCRNLVTSTTE